MSDDITQQYLEARYEHYLDTGLDPKDAYTNAMQDADEYTVMFLTARYEEYLDQGYSPKDSEIMAYEDLEHDQYDHVPEEEEDNES